MNVVGLVLSDDLLFASQITGFAHDRGVKVRVVRDSETLMQMIDQYQPKCVFLDLQLTFRQNPKLIQELLAANDRPLLIGYGSHVETATLETARLAGCDLVMPRSAFARRLPGEISHWLAGQPTAIEPS